MKFGPVVPILRMFDESTAKDFYIGFVGCAIDWEHRFAPDLPLYMQVSLGGCRIHLSGHHGDATPGGAIRVSIEGLDAFHTALLAKKYKHARPGVEAPPWGGREMTVIDPSGNRLVFVEEAQS